MHRSTITVVGLVATAALLAPTALAERPDDRAGLRGVGAIATAVDDSVRPDDRSGLLGVGSITTSEAPPWSRRRPDDRAGIRGPGRAGMPQTSLVVDGGFDWRDAGIGLAGGLALALVGAGLLATTHRRRMHPAA